MSESPFAPHHNPTSPPVVKPKADPFVRQVEKIVKTGAPYKPPGTRKS